ncbi:MAG: DegQ family serine endoprotease [Calditrichia bacterium]
MKRWGYFFTVFAAGVLFLYPQRNSATMNDLQQSIFAARNKVMPALVHVEPIKSFFTTGERRHTLVTGSGFIFSAEGYILTNHHVVENAEKVKCTLWNKKELSAEVVGSDPSTDVAVLKLIFDEGEMDSLHVARLGNSDSIEVGQIVLALGSPLGLSRSVSMGVISSIDRYFADTGSMVSPYNLWIQTDAAINPGNSGGPLINLDGDVIGINARGVFLAENLGFAIPINLAKEVADKLIAGQKIRRSWIGMEFQPIKEYREYLGIAELRGVLVAGLDPLSPAQEADLRPGDVVQQINEIPVNAEYDEDLPTIRKIIADIPPHEEVSFRIWRNGKTKVIKLETRLEPFEYLPEFECREWGLVVKSITQPIFRVHNMKDYDGVIVSGVKSGESADQAGLRAGDIIRVVNQKRISSLSDFKELYQKLVGEKEKFVYFEVLRDGATYFAALKNKTDNTSVNQKQ